MTAPPLSPTEAATVERFDVAVPAPESWRPDRAARNPTCCEHAASDHDTHGCAVNLSTHPRTYERCHGLVPAVVTMPGHRPEPAETCAPERLLWINHTPHRVCCNRDDHWWTVPPAHITAPKDPSAGSRR